MASEPAIDRMEDLLTRASCVRRNLVPPQYTR